MSAFFSIRLVSLCLLLGALPSLATVTTQTYHRMGEDGVLPNNRPTDASGNQRNFINQINGSGVTLDSASPAPASTSAYVFNGSNQGYYDAGYDAPEDNVGIEAWVRSGDLTQLDRTVFGTGGSLGGLNLLFDAAHGGFCASLAGVSWVGSGYMPASTSEWVHLALVRDGGVTTFYVNGTAFGSTNGDVPVNGSVFHLAVNSGGSKYFKGAVDELRVFTFAPGAFSPADLLHTPPAPEPHVIGQPGDTLVPAGDTATFTVFATGADTMQYQWYRSPSGTPVTGATAATLTLTNTAAADAGGYYAVISNSHGSATSQTATLHLALSPTPATTPGNAQQAQINRKYGMFCHFGINTFANQEWTDGTLPATTFAPTAVDADQWVLTAKAAGMRYLLLTTKHHDGFCLWDSQWTTYDVASSSVPNIDVVKLVSEACARHGIRFAIYYSLWDRHEPCYSNAAEYVTYMKRQLTELLTQYGPVAELWLDGGWDKPNSAWNVPALYHVVKTLQPECQFSVNWTIGLPAAVDSGGVKPLQQETGYPIRYFPSDFRTADPEMPKFPDPKVFTHNGNNYYLPLEATVTTAAGNHWFYHTGDTGAKPLAVLEKMFNISTAQNNLLVFNAAPNRDGVLMPSNVAALTGLAWRLGMEPDRPHPVNLAATASVTANSMWASPGYEAPNACDDNPDTRWAAAAGDIAPWLDIDFGTPTRFDRVIVNEYGENNVYRCTSFQLEAWNGTSWDVIHNGTTLGESARLDLTTPVAATKLRLRILASSGPVSIWMIKVQDSARPNPAQSSYRLWQEQNFSLAEINAGDAAPTLAPADDGIANGLKYALGIDNVRRPYSGAALTPLVVGAGDALRFTFQRARHDARYTVQASQDLVTWSNLASDPGSVGSAASVAFPETSSGRSFLRLTVEPEP